MRKQRSGRPQAGRDEWVLRRLATDPISISGPLVSESLSPCSTFTCVFYISGMCFWLCGCGEVVCRMCTPHCFVVFFVSEPVDSDNGSLCCWWGRQPSLLQLGDLVPRRRLSSTCVSLCSALCCPAFWCPHARFGCPFHRSERVGLSQEGTRWYRSPQARPPHTLRAESWPPSNLRRHPL